MTTEILSDIGRPKRKRTGVPRDIPNRDVRFCRDCGVAVAYFGPVDERTLSRRMVDLANCHTDNHAFNGYRCGRCAS